MSAMILSEINVYPIKSLGGTALRESKIEERGLQFDRRWMLVDADGEFLTQREFPQMARISVNVRGDGLSVNFDGKKNLVMPFAPFANEKIEKISVRIWQDFCDAAVADSAINNWFSDVLKIDCRLVFMPDDSRRAVEKEFAVADDAVSFADAFPFLLIGENTLRDLNNRLETPLPMNRFRPNLVVKNSAAFAEDEWKIIKIGDNVFHGVKPCARCVITTIDQTRGGFDGKEPLQTLANYRRSQAGKVLFGQNLIAANTGGTIRIGETIEILA